jgi:hypothetical protein
VTGGLDYLLDGSLDVVDLPFAGLPDKVVADGLVGRVGAGLALMSFAARWLPAGRLRRTISAFNG